MKGRTAKTEKAEAPKSRKQPKDKLKGKMVMVGGAMRPQKLYGGGKTYEGGKISPTTGTARGMGAAVKGGKFRDL